MASDYKIYPIFPPNSLFRFIDEILNTPHLSSDRPLHRICSLMRKMDAQSIICEEINADHDEELKTEIESLNIFYGNNVEYSALNITFLDTAIDEIEEVDSLKDNAILASVLLVQFKVNIDNEPIWYPYILRAVIPLPSRKKSDQNSGTTSLLNNYFYAHNTFSCKILCGPDKYRTFDVEGTFFCQQNSKTSVCAHASLKMLVNNYPGHDLNSAQINKLAGITPRITDQRFASSWGMYIDEFSPVLENQGFRSTQYNFFDYPTWDYAKNLHYLIESKTPSLLVFTTDRDMHVVPVFGHTLNTDMWRPEAEYLYRNSLYRLTERSITGAPLSLDNHLSTSAWVDHFIVHDDNFGPYYCLPVDSLRRPTLPKYDPSFRAILVMGIYPKNLDIVTPTREAEWISIKHFQHLFDLLSEACYEDNYWLRLSREHNISGSPWVVRTALIDKQSYLKQLSTKSDHDQDVISESNIDNIAKILPSHFYITEITISDLFTANKAKIGEILYSYDKIPWDPTTDDSDSRFYDGIIGGRIPGFFIDWKSQSICPIETKKHIPMMRINTDLNCNEW